VEIPDNAAFVVFGGIAILDGNPQTSGNLYTDNVFYYILNDACANQIINRTFFYRQSGQPFVLYPGSMT